MNQEQKQQLGPNQSQPVDRLKLEIIPLKGGVDGSAGGGTLGTAFTFCGTLGTFACFADEE